MAEGDAVVSDLQVKGTIGTIGHGPVEIVVALANALSDGRQEVRALSGGGAVRMVGDRSDVEAVAVELVSMNSCYSIGPGLYLLAHDGVRDAAGREVGNLKLGHLRSGEGSESGNGDELHFEGNLFGW